MIISHIIHEIRPQAPDVLPPANHPAEEFAFIQAELTPLILQVMANDIGPVLPMCKYPDGTAFYLHDAPDPNPASTIVDPQELFEDVLDGAISALSETASVATLEALNGINVSDVVEDLLIQSEDGELAERVIVIGHNTEASAQYTDDGTTMSASGSTNFTSDETQ